MIIKLNKLCKSLTSKDTFNGSEKNNCKTNLEPLYPFKGFVPGGWFW